jgi:chromosome segregation ATPase
MKRLIPLVIVLLVIFLIQLLADSEPNYPAIEVRMLALEEKVAALEQRINQLENSGYSPLESPTDSNDADSNDAKLDCVRASKQIQDARDSIELIKQQIQSLDGIDTKTAENDREVDSKLYKLTVDLERNYSKIIHLAEKCPDLGIDIMKAKKVLIECQARKREMEMKRKYLQDKIQKPSPKSSSQIPDSSPPTRVRRPIKRKGVFVPPQ